MSGLFTGGAGSNFSGFPPTDNRQVGGSGGGSSSNAFGGMNLLQQSSQPANNAFSSLSFSSAGHGVPGGSGRLFSRTDGGKFGDSLLSPNTFDPSEFPSLGNRDNSAPNPSLSARPNYVGMVKQPAMETSEFTMSHEDFPALPGAPSMPNSGLGHQTLSMGPIGSDSNALSGSSGVNSQQDLLSSNQSVASLLSGVASAAAAAAAAVSSASGDGSSTASTLQNDLRRGIQTSPQGTVTNIPPSMVTDQFGMIGLLTFIRAAETDQHLVSLALGADLTSLGLNLSSEHLLRPTFGGPWAETPCRPQDIDCHVPFEYLTNSTIRDKLAPVKLNRYKDDVLFYMFYTNVGDVLQLAAAAELYSRDWRYHKEDKIWITRAPGLAPLEKTNSFERGTYYFFDVNSWRKVSKEFCVDYDKLEDRPSLPTANQSSMMSHQQGPPPQQQAMPSSSSSPAPPGMPMSATGIPSSNSTQQHSPIMSATSTPAASNAAVSSAAVGSGGPPGPNL